MKAELGFSAPAVRASQPGPRWSPPDAGDEEPGTGRQRSPGGPWALEHTPPPPAMANMSQLRPPRRPTLHKHCRELSVKPVGGEITLHCGARRQGYAQVLLTGQGRRVRKPGRSLILLHTTVCQ